MCWMMGFVEISTISTSFKISVNPTVRVEVPQSFKQYLQTQPHAMSHLFHFSTDIPGHS